MNRRMKDFDFDNCPTGFRQRDFAYTRALRKNDRRQKRNAKGDRRGPSRLERRFR